MATTSGDCCWSWMPEVAGEELAKLEAAHPGRFGPLKAELRRLVGEPGRDAAALSPCAGATATPSSSSAAAQAAAPAAPPPLPHLSSTQESSTRNRKRNRKPANGACEGEGGKRKRTAGATAAPPGGSMKDRAEMAIERAERCLERIRAIKRSLLASWTK